MVRRVFIERALRQIYNGFVPDDVNISDNLVNVWLSDGIGIAAKKNYTDNYQLEGIGFVNNSFYSTFKGLTITEDEQFLYKCALPELPLGIGATEAISRIIFKDTNGNKSYPAVILSENQVSYQRSLRPIPNKTICYPEGKYLYIETAIIMSLYTASVTLISGGDSTDLDSELNIPADYMAVCVEYIKAQLLLEKAQMADQANDGVQN